LVVEIRQENHLGGGHPEKIEFHGGNVMKKGYSQKESLLSPVNCPKVQSKPYLLLGKECKKKRPEGATQGKRKKGSGKNP